MYEHVKWEYEDKLDADIDIVNSMFEASQIIDGVRMYPYIEVKGTRYYLAV